MTRPSGARWSSPGTISAIHVRSVTSSTAPRRFDAVSSGPNIRKVSVFRAMTSRSTSRGRASPRRSSRRARHVDRVVAEVGQLEVAEELAAVRDGVRAHPPRARGRQAASSGSSAPLARRTAPRAGRSASSASRIARLSAFVRTSLIGTWWRASCPRPGGRRSPSGRSSPWASGARSSATAGAR